MKRLKVFLASLAIAAGLLIPAAPALAATDPFGDACKMGGAGASSACDADGSNPLTGPNGTLTKVTRLIAYITGVAAIILMVVAGIMYVTSDGDAVKVNSAKNTLIYALVGLVIVCCAPGIVVFVLFKL